MEFAEKEFGSEITIGDIQAKFFKKIVLKELLIKDIYGDTLIYVDRMTFGLRALNFDEKHITLSEIELWRADVNFKADTVPRLNFDYFLDKFKNPNKPDSLKSKWVFNSEDVRIIDSRFRLYDRPKDRAGINFGDLDLRSVNILASNFKVEKGVVTFDQENLTFIDKSGFQVDYFNAKTVIDKEVLSFYDSNTRTPQTKLMGRKIILKHDNFESFKNSGILTKVVFDLDIKPSQISFEDILLIVPDLQPNKERFLFSGRVYGKFNALKMKGVELYAGENSIFKGDVYFNDLPDLKNTYVHANIEHMTTNREDVNTIDFPRVHPGNVRLPEFLDQLGTVQYTGSFTGYFTDFVADGRLTTDIGVLDADLLLKPDTLGNISFSGDLSADKFHLGPLMQLKQVGYLSFDASGEGVIQGDSNVIANLAGNISRLDIRGYGYRNIEFKGGVEEMAFNGEIYVKDPNLDMDFKGLIDLSVDIPEHNFKSQIYHANLASLNILKTDTLMFVKGLVDANFRGNDIGELDGNLYINEVEFQNSLDTLLIDEVRLFARNEGAHNLMTVKSEIAEGRLEGEYKFYNISKSLKSLFYNYLDAFKPKTFQYGDTTDVFAVEIVMKDPKPFMDFFMPKYALSKGTVIEGYYNSRDHVYDVIATAPFFIIDEKIVKSFSLNTTSNDTLFEVNAECEYLEVDEFRIKNIFLNGLVGQNLSALELKWDNQDSIAYKGLIKSESSFQKSEITGNTISTFKLLPSEVVIADTLWDIDQALVVNDSSTFSVVDDIFFRNGLQSVWVDGSISENPGDSLNIRFVNFDLLNIDPVIRDERIDLKGIIHGNATFVDYYNSFKFFSELTVDQFRFNDVMLGQTHISSIWENQSERMAINAKSNKGKLRTFQLKSYYYPKSKAIDADFSINKLDLSAAEPFLIEIASEMEGLTSGVFDLSGVWGKPVLNGNANVKRGKFKVDYLNVFYSVTDEVEFVNNELIATDVKIYDPEGHVIDVNGKISSNYLRDFYYDFNLSFQDALLLDTKLHHNEDFYGKAYGSGSLSITGPPNNLVFNAKGVTRPNTVINIPLSEDETVTELNYIRFKKVRKKARSEIELYKKRKKVSATKVTFYTDVEITPDAQFQLIFDSKIGDVIRSTTRGNVQMEIDTRDLFNMYGNVVVVDGDYLFTLQNVINKPFVLQRGGTIVWTGDPYNAQIDLEAIYSVRTILADLLPEEFLVGEGASRYNNKLLVDCKLILTGPLENPQKVVEIDLPTSDEESRNLLRSIVNNDQERLRQFAALLVARRFLPESGLGSLGQTVGVVSTSELLYSQLSHWLSQISDDLNISINYTPQGENYTSELEINLSTQILNDRVTINSNLDFAGSDAELDPDLQSGNQNVIGDFDLDVQLTENGKFRFKAFNREQNDLNRLGNNYNYTQGAGFFFREEFNTFKELFSRYFSDVFNKNKTAVDNNDQN